MKKPVLAFAFSLIMLCTLFATPSSAFYETPTLFDAPHTLTSSGILYGPPIPANESSLLTHVGIDILKDVEDVVPETLTYIVKGDSLSSIAATFNTKFTTLAELNDLANTNLLKIDQEIQIPNLERKQIDPSLNVKSVLSADLTAYTAGYESTGKSPGDPEYGVTASGKYVKEQQTIAVDPSVIPIGTKVYIEGIGVRVAEDTGGAIIGNRIDVYMSDLSAAIQFGYKKNIKVYVLDSSQSA